MGKQLIACLSTISLLFIISSSIKAADYKENIKKGWNVAPFPALSFNSDLGLQYGAFCDLFHYGDGSLYPNYRHKFSIEVSRFTKGSGVYRFFYDSKYLIPDTRLTFDVSYLPDKMLDFYGYNGYVSPYFKGMNKSFYKMNRDMFRFTIDFQRIIRGNWAWAVGFAYYNYQIGKVKLKKYQHEPSLYEYYLSHGLIHEDEANGGNITQFKAGMVYDSRDIEGDPTRGIFSEAIFTGSPDLIDGKDYHHLKISVVFRQYVPVWKKKLTLAYRLGYQSNIAGRVPFYVQSNISTLYMRQTYSEGLGGTTSLRGILRNRIVGDGFAWTNLEFRYRFLNFQLLKQNWYFVINPLFDAGIVTKSFRAKHQKNSQSPYLYSNDHESLHATAGIGAKIVMNHNFVFSLEYGKALDTRDGESGLNLYMNFLF